MKHEIPRGTALVITGAPGSGKSRLAREVASRYGKVAEISADDLTSTFGFGEVLSYKPAVLIVDGDPPNACTARILKRMITEKSVIVHRKCMEPSTVSSPRLIIISNSVSAQPLYDDARRYRVLECNQAHA